MIVILLEMYAGRTMRPATRVDTVDTVDEGLPAPFTPQLSPRQWVAVDILLAAVLAGLSIHVISTKEVHPAGAAWDVARGAAVMVACLPLPFRRRYPMQVLAVVTAAVVTMLSLGARGPAVASVAFAMYSVAATSERRTSPAVVAIPIAGLNLAAIGQPEWGWLIAGAAVVLAGWLAGERARSHRVYLRSLADRAAERVQQAAFEERLRIARELHDVVAHAMSVIAVRSGVARMVLDTQPAEARESLSIVETTSRRALQEMRHLVGVLRQPEDAGPELAPAPGLAELAGLVEQIGQAGVIVDVEVTGDARRLPPGVDVSAYRIVQEALTNVVRHAGPGTARCWIRYHPGDVEIEVVDSGGAVSQPAPDGNGSGHGLVGMQERVNLYRGALSAGPFGRGFRVLARLPTDGTDGDGP
ncbi:MAG TPA: sensor histidine kinase [Acidimicrobiales bacterium]